MRRLLILQNARHLPYSLSQNVHFYKFDIFSFRRCWCAFDFGHSAIVEVFLIEKLIPSNWTQAQTIDWKNARERERRRNEVEMNSSVNGAQTTYGWFDFDNLKYWKWSEGSVWASTQLRLSNFRKLCLSRALLSRGLQLFIGKLHVYWLSLFSLSKNWILSLPERCALSGATQMKEKRWTKTVLRQIGWNWISVWPIVRFEGDDFLRNDMKFHVEDW